ncbi:hypothetical protein SGLAM104S_06997 [Streptomyces glaucescens]
MAVVTFVDETTTGERSAARALDIAEERLTVRALIGRRVAAETAAHNARTTRGEDRRDPACQTELALRAFAGNGLLVLVGDRQVTDPDEEIRLVSGTEVTFLKLVPLVGG